jgi:hypothetical protein
VTIAKESEFDICHLVSAPYLLVQELRFSAIFTLAIYSYDEDWLHVNVAIPGISGCSDQMLGFRSISK